jgi:protein-disulfide isomerase
MIALAAALVWQGRDRLFGTSVGSNPTGPQLKAPAEPVVISDGSTRGVPSAPVVLIEFSDFECPYCAKFAIEIAPPLLKEYVDQGRLLVVFKDYPLPKHSKAEPAAIAAWCAGRQGKFWEIHDVLFQYRGALRDSDFDAAARTTGLDGAAYQECRNSNEARQHVALNKAEGVNLGVPATPAFLIGRRVADGRVKVEEVVVGPKDINDLRAPIDRLLAK